MEEERWRPRNYVRMAIAEEEILRVPSSWFGFYIMDRLIQRAARNQGWATPVTYELRNIRTEPFGFLITFEVWPS